MIVLVSDTSVLIDLERGGLLEAAFSCGLTLIVPDLLYQRGLEATNGPFLRSLGLGVTSLSPNEVSYAQELKAQRKALSLPDCFALSCATRANHALVSGDKALCNEAKRKVESVFGLLWLLDQMAEADAFDLSLLSAGLRTLAADPRCRLPMDEVKARLEAWEGET